MAIHPTRNIGLKVLSLAMATTLWFIVAREEMSEAIFRAPVEFVNIPPSLEIAGDPPSQVQIRIRTSSTIMRKIWETGLVARIDMRLVRPGTRLIALNADNFDLPFGCQVIRINPTGFDIAIEERDSRSVAVSPRLEGRVAEGFEIVSLNASPARVLVEGPQSRVRRLSSVTTEAVSVEGLVTSLSQRVALVVPDPSCRLPEENSAQLDITIIEKQEYRTLMDVPVETVPGSKQVTVSPTTVQIRVQGPISKLRYLRSEEIRARIDVATLASGQHELAPHIVFSNYADNIFKVLEIQPEKIKVAVR